MRREDREIKDIKAIEEILLKCKTCHVAMTDGSLPYVVPLSYGYRFTDGGALELFFHSALHGKKLDMLKINNKVCFEISDEGEPTRTETPCNSGYYYSSMIGYGEAVFIDDAVGKCEGLSAIVRHQINRDVDFTEEQAENVCVFKIISNDFSGKQKHKP